MSIAATGVENVTVHGGIDLDFDRAARNMSNISGSWSRFCCGSTAAPEIPAAAAAGPLHPA